MSAHPITISAALRSALSAQALSLLQKNFEDVREQKMVNNLATRKELARKAKRKSQRAARKRNHP